jgi:Ran GTPase-activating protein (RanGAP) involved in mRNA processing and transport
MAEATKTVDLDMEALIWDMSGLYFPQRFNLEGWGIGEDGQQGMLGNAIESNPNLTELLVSGIYISFLNVPGNSLGDEGAFVVATALKSHPALMVIDFSDNGVSSDGVAELCDAICENFTLQTLKLNGLFFLSF